MLVSPRSYEKPLKTPVSQEKQNLVSQVSLKDGEKISFDAKTNNNSLI